MIARALPPPPDRSRSRLKFQKGFQEGKLRGGQPGRIICTPAAAPDHYSIRPDASSRKLPAAIAPAAGTAPTVPPVEAVRPIDAIGPIAVAVVRAPEAGPAIAVPAADI